MSQIPPSHRRKIRNYLLDRKVQLRVALIMVTLTSALTAALGYIWYSEVRNASAVVEVNALSILGPSGSEALKKELASNDRSRLLVLSGFGLALAFLVVGYGIVMTHKIAGPLFKMKRYMADIESGRLYKLTGLRKGDQLQDFFTALERMHAALRERTEADVLLLGAVIEKAEKGEALTGELEHLRKSRDAKLETLREAGANTLKIRRPQG